MTSDMENVEMKCSNCALCKEYAEKWDARKKRLVHCETWYLCKREALSPNEVSGNGHCDRWRPRK